MTEEEELFFVVWVDTGGLVFNDESIGSFIL